MPAPGPILKAEALEVANKIGLKYTYFKASNGWLRIFI
jgi:hypothetical protein